MAPCGPRRRLSGGQIGGLGIAVVVTILITQWTERQSRHYIDGGWLRVRIATYARGNRRWSLVFCHSFIIAKSLDNSRREVCVPPSLSMAQKHGSEPTYAISTV